MAALAPPHLQLIARAPSVPLPSGSAPPPTGAGSSFAATSRQSIVLYAIIAVSATVLVLLIVAMFITLRRRRRRMELYEASQVSFGPSIGRGKGWWADVAQTGLSAATPTGRSRFKEEDALSPSAAVERPASARLSASAKPTSFGREFLRNSTGYAGRRASVLRTSFAGGLASSQTSHALTLVDEHFDGQQQQPNGVNGANGSADNVFDPHSAPMPTQAPVYLAIDPSTPSTPMSPVTPVPLRDTFAADAQTPAAPCDVDLRDRRVRADSVIVDRRLSLTAAPAHGGPGPPWQKHASLQRPGTDPDSDVDRQDTPPPIL